MKREQAEERARVLGHPLTSWWPSTLYQEAHAACRCGAVTAKEFVPYSRDGRGSYVVLTGPTRAGEEDAMHTRREPPPRLPLEVVIGRRTADNVLADELVVIKPGDDDYEHAYAYAAQCYRMEGEPMPYITEANAAPTARREGDR